MCILDAACDGVALALFQLNRQQRLQVSQICLPLLDGLFSQWSALLRDRRQSQDAALLFDRGLLQVLYGSLYAGTSRRSWS